MKNKKPTYNYNFKIDLRPFDKIEDIYNYNIEVFITLEGGRKFIATFYTLKNICAIMENDRSWGDCANGTYFWACDCIIVNELTLENMHVTIKDLLERDHFFSALSEIIPGDDRDENEMDKSLQSLIWTGDYKTRIYDLLAEKGYQSLTSYFCDHPDIPVIKLARQEEFLRFDLFRPIASRQLIEVFSIESMTNGNTFFFFKDMLVRIMNDENMYYDLSDMFFNWRNVKRSFPLALHTYIDEKMDKVEAIINEIIPNDGTWIPKSPTWIPKNSDDPYIADAFNRVWPSDDIMNKLLADAKAYITKNNIRIY